MTVRIEVLYFAALRDAAGIAAETVETDAENLAALYSQVQGKHRLPFPQRQLRVAMDGAFAAWGDPLRDGATVAFIPPVSGG